MMNEYKRYFRKLISNITISWKQRKFYKYLKNNKKNYNQ